MISLGGKNRGVEVIIKTERKRNDPRESADA
jgi:hypothetical protein